MPILFRCENCQQKLSVSSRKAGKVLPCPKCGNDLQVPIPPGKDPQPDALPPTREFANSDKEQEEKAWAATRELSERPNKPRESQQEADLVFEESPPPPAATLAVRQSSFLNANDSPSPPQSEFSPGPQSQRPAEDDEEEFTLRRATSDMEEMDLTPMVDVTFLLLIFFMITASFSLTKAIETPAPDPESQGAQTIQTLEDLQLTSIIVKIDDQDAILVDDEPVDPADLEDRLGDILLKDKKNELIIKASPLCKHETFVAVFDAATSADMQKIRLATTRGEE